ncbi:MAG: DUF1788 domain-containing protein [Bacteroidales bacterium]|nr:DUF1788 domain-containing protein [Bacteroidales bacterium]
MTVKELYEKLKSPEFKKSENIFYNYYIYQYNADKEYETRQQIEDFKRNLKRPTTYEDPVLLDLFSLFCEYLQEESFGEQSLLELTLEEELDENNMTTEELTNEANSDGFIEYVHQFITTQRKIENEFDHSYVFVYGIGKMFPYLRTNVFLTKYEEYNDPNKYKIILFYPGEQKGNSFSLFHVLEDSHTYRATLLVNK